MQDERHADNEPLLERHHADAYQWARVCCGGGQQAADVLQTAYVRILSGAAKFAGRSSFKTWLLGVIRWVAHEERRKMLRFEQRFTDLDAAAHVQDEQPLPDASLIQDEHAARVLSLLDALPDRQREVLHLVFYQELTIQEAADALGITVGTARQHYERGKAALRRQMTPPSAHNHE